MAGSQNPVMANIDGEVVFERAVLDRYLESLKSLAISEIRKEVDSFRESISTKVTLDAPPGKNGLIGFDESTHTGGDFRVKHAILDRQLEQISGSRTEDRAIYYIERLRKYVSSDRKEGLDLNRWQDYDEIITDSFWNVESRDRSEMHDAGYWGNFVPLIPRQLMLRYTKPGDLVLEPFMGAGTTLFEAVSTDRNYLGVDIIGELVEKARAKVSGSMTKSKYFLYTGNSCETDFSSLLRENGFEASDLVIMHPPYHDIIHFTDDPRDLSNASSLDGFLLQFSRIAASCVSTLRPGGYLAAVIGDKYASGEWVPLGFLVMQELARTGLILKSIVVKNFNRTRGKRGQERLWRYRALAGGYYVFKHEYILVFRKPA